ncbi:MAG: hypothetical protein ACRDRZ_11005 [Pseudonocardiaceae bacterium]
MGLLRTGERYEDPALLAMRWQAERAEQRRRDRRARRLALVGRVARGAGRLAWRHRRGLAPLVLLGAVWAAGAAVSGASVGGAVLVGCLAGLVVLVRLRGRLARRAEQVYALVCIAAAVGWLGLAAGAGLARVDTLLVGGFLLAWPWWDHHRRRPRPAPPVAAEGVDETVAPRWQAHIGCEGGPVAGARLGDPVAFEHGQDHTLALVPGRQHLGTVRMALPLIGTGIGRPLSELLVEQHPEHTSPAVLRLRVVTRSPITATTWFEGPDGLFGDGAILLGPHVDGDGEGLLRLFAEDSMLSGFILAGPGAGKSRLLETIAIVARWVGVPLIYLDGQRGASSPALWRHATWRGGPEEAPTVLAALERGAAMRSKHNALHGDSGFSHDPRLPGILTIIDECHRIFTPQTGERWAERPREDRKLGLSYLAASQAAGVATFGGHEALRSCLMEGNILVGRTRSTVSAGMIPGLDMDPTEFPALPGYFHAIGTADSGARTAPFRGRRVPLDRHKSDDPTIRVASVEEWLRRLPQPQIDTMTARAFGPDFEARHEHAAQRDARLRAEVNGEVADEPHPAPADQGDDEAGGPGGWIAAAILALPWDTVAEMTREQIIEGVAATGRTVSVSGVQKALRGLSQPGGALAQPAHGRYRREVAA